MPSFVLPKLSLTRTDASWSDLTAYGWHALVNFQQDQQLEIQIWWLDCQLMWLAAIG